MAGTQRRRINDGGPTARQAVQQRVLGNIGLRGLRMLGTRPAGQGLAVAGSPAALGAGGGVFVHRMVVRADPQTVADGAGLVCGVPTGAPTSQYGFAQYIPGDTAVTVDLAGVLHVDVALLWDSYRDGGAVQVVHTRGSTETVHSLWEGPITSRHFVGSVRNLDVRPGDTVEIRPNHSGSSQDLTSAEVELTLHVTRGATSDVPVPAVCDVEWDGTYVVPVSGATQPSAVELDDGRVLYVWVASNAVKQGFAADVTTFLTTNSSVTYDQDIVTGAGAVTAAVTKIDGVLWLSVARLVTSTTAAASIYRSDDDGASWSLVQNLTNVTSTTMTVVSGTGPISQVFKTAAGSLVVAGPRHYASGSNLWCDSGWWRSTDGGASWSLVHTNTHIYTRGRTRSVAQGDDGTIVSGIFTDNTHGTRQVTSTDDGASWSDSAGLGNTTGYPWSGTICRLCDGFYFVRPSTTHNPTTIYKSDDPTDYYSGGTAFEGLAVTSNSGDDPLLTLVGDRVALFTKDRVYPGGTSQEAA